MVEWRVSPLYSRNLLIGTMKMAKSFACLPRLWSWSSYTAWSAALSKNFYFNDGKMPAKWIWSGTYPIINDLLRFLLATHAWFVNTFVLTRLRLRQAPVFTGNVLLATKSSQTSYYSGYIHITAPLQRQPCVIFFYIGIIYSSNPRSKMKLQICLTRFWLSSDTPGKQM